MEKISNILFISPNPVWGGAATANLEIATMLQKNGYKVIVNDEYYLYDNYNGLKIDHTPIHKKRFSNRKLLQKLIMEHDINCIIWSPLVAIYFYLDIIKLKKYGINQIAIVHSLSLRQNWKGRLMDYLISKTLADMSSIVYVSKYTLNSWNKYRAIRNSKSQQVVIHNIVDYVSNEKHILQINRPRIGFVGRLSIEKQPDIFCKLSINRKYKFMAYGDGPLESDLKDNYRNVEFKGLYRDITQIYSNIDILVITSRFENCPMVILEAQAFGIPCVAPNVGGIPEIIENGINGILYEDYDVESINKAITEIISNYQFFSNHCLEHSKKHNSIATIKHWKQIL